MKPETVFIEFDKAGAEWVITAYMAGDAQMIRVIESGESPHVHTGHLITRVPKHLIEKEHSLIKASTDPDFIEDMRRKHLPELFEGDYFLPRIFSIRQSGKKSNHGLNYRMGFARFALENEMPEQDAKTIWSAYRNEAYPNLQTWWKAIDNQLKIDRTLINPLGRKQRFLEQWGPDLFMQATAFLPQSTNADVVNQAIIKIYNNPSKMLQTLKFKAQVHDSILYSYVVTNWLEFARLVHYIRSELEPTLTTGGREFVIKTDMKVGYSSWGAMKPVAFGKGYEETARNLKSTQRSGNEKKAA
jgi:hypothetical protein